MAEWSMAVVLKTTVGETPPGVRIPLSPPPSLAHARSVSARAVCPFGATCFARRDLHRIILSLNLRSCLQRSFSSSYLHARGPIADTLRMAHWCLATALGLVTLVGPSARAQTASSPSRPDLSGTWTIDPDVGTELAKITLIPSSNNNNARQMGGMRRGGGFGGRSFGGGSRPRDQNSGPKLTNDEQARLKAM